MPKRHVPQPRTDPTLLDDILVTYYRSTTLDGRVWCESRDPEEVVRMSKGTPVAFSRYDVYRVTLGWKPWAP